MSELAVLHGRVVGAHLGGLVGNGFHYSCGIGMGGW